MNIDKDNDILIKEDDKLDTISLETFKEMTMGVKAGKEATHEIKKSKSLKQHK